MKGDGYVRGSGQRRMGGAKGLGERLQSCGPYPSGSDREVLLAICDVHITSPIRGHVKKKSKKKKQRVRPVCTASRKESGRVVS